MERSFAFVGLDPSANTQTAYLGGRRPSFFRRFCRCKRAVFGAVVLALVALSALLGPVFSPYRYSDQNLSLGGLPPFLKIVPVDETTWVYVHPDLKLILVSPKGDVLGAAEKIGSDAASASFEVGEHVLTLDYSAAASKEKGDHSLHLICDGSEMDFSKAKTVHNRTFWLGSDQLGRDVLVRNLYGARLSLLVGLAAALVNGVIGVLYGAIAGYLGGRADDWMMRFVDFVDSVPLLLIVILLSVLLGDSRGIGGVILAIGLVYWVGMARQVRAKVLQLRGQEFILAARAIGLKGHQILFRHLIPNAWGPILVTLTMSVPSAIFTEAFLSFIGLGVAAPLASWGTLVSDALGGMRSFPYLLVVPCVLLALTMFALHFIGEGVQEAIQPPGRH